MNYVHLICPTIHIACSIYLFKIIFTLCIHYLYLTHKTKILYNNLINFFSIIYHYYCISAFNLYISYITYLYTIKLIHIYLFCTPCLYTILNIKVSTNIWYNCPLIFKLNMSLIVKKRNYYILTAKANTYSCHSPDNG